MNRRNTCKDIPPDWGAVPCRYPSGCLRSNAKIKNIFK
jgi:hypothetical protein